MSMEEEKGTLISRHRMSWPLIGRLLHHGVKRPVFGLEKMWRAYSGSAQRRTRSWIGILSDVSLWPVLIPFNAWATW